MVNGIDSALGWIGDLVSWFSLFIPRQVHVDSVHGAIKWVNPLRLPWRGPEQTAQRVIALPSGRWWYWPWTSEFQKWPVARDGVDLPTQVITTADDVTVNISGMVVFEVFDLEALLARTSNPDRTVKEVTIAVLHDALCELSYPDLRELQSGSKLESKLKTKALWALKPYGVKVLQLTLTEFAKSRVYRLVQSTMTDGN